MRNRRYVKESVVSKITGLSPQTLRNHRVLNKGIPYYKLGRSVRYFLKDVYDYVESRKVNTN